MRKKGDKGGPLPGPVFILITEPFLKMWNVTLQEYGLLAPLPNNTTAVGNAYADDVAVFRTK
jgi:hypothetical protein